MGKALSDLMSALDPDDKEAKAGLEMLRVLLNGKLDAAKSNIQLDIEHEVNLPMIAVVDREEMYKADVSQAPTDFVEKVVGNFLGNDDVPGILDSVNSAMQVLFGESSVSEQSQRSFHLAFSNNALVRFDYWAYRYSEDDIQWMKVHKGGFAYYMQTAVLDLHKCDPQIVLYELSKSFGVDGHEKATRWLSQMTELGKLLYRSVYDLDKMVKGEFPEDDEKREPPVFKEPDHYGTI